MEEKNKMDSNYDSLRGWREEITKYAGGTEEDATADAIREYMRQEEAKKRAAKEGKKTQQPQTQQPKPQEPTVEEELSL